MSSAFYYRAISIALHILVYRILFFLLIDLFAILPAWPLTVWELWFYWAPSINLQRLQPFFPCTFVLSTKQTLVRALHCLLSQDTFLWCSTLLNYAKTAYSTDILPICLQVVISVFYTGKRHVLWKPFSSETPSTPITSWELIMDPAVFILQLHLKAPVWTETGAPSCFTVTQGYVILGPGAHTKL